MSDIRVYRAGKLTDIKMTLRQSLSSFLGPDLAPGWEDVIIVVGDSYFKPAIRYGAMDVGEFYYHCTMLSNVDPQILLSEALLG